ncbi:MAG: hypothetical protein ACFFER_09100 [Candidatus Thorarchaeota archaeon]
MSEEIGFKTLILYLSAVALALFYLLYTPWTALSSYASGMGAEVWVYYFALVLGLLFPLYYAIGQENMAWIVLGLAIIVNSIVWLIVQPTASAAAVMILIVGLLFFLGPILEPRVGNWDLIKNIFHILKGLFIILAAGFYANWVLDDFIGTMSINHIMPPFLYMGGGLFVAFGIILFMYGLFKLLKMYTGETAGKFFGDLAKIFYILMVLVFLLGITYNVTAYIFLNPWGAAGFPTSIDFFGDMRAVGISNLGAILLIILYIYGMSRIAEKLGQ